MAHICLLRELYMLIKCDRQIIHLQSPRLEGPTVPHVVHFDAAARCNIDPQPQTVAYYRTIDPDPLIRLPHTPVFRVP